MSLHLQKFVDRVRGAEARGLKDFTMSLNDAKDLHADITRLLIELEKIRSAIAQTAGKEEVITVQVGGGSF
jgi:hypothetical protein